jgi:hypothetical protein
VERLAYRVVTSHPSLISSSLPPIFNALEVQDFRDGRLVLEVDQISVQVLPSANVCVSSGAINKGLFVSLNGGPGAGECYQISHPIAYVSGVLRGSFYATVHECSIVTCTGCQTESCIRMWMTETYLI